MLAGEAFFHLFQQGRGNYTCIARHAQVNNGNLILVVKVGRIVLYVGQHLMEISKDGQVPLILL